MQKKDTDQTDINTEQKCTAIVPNTWTEQAPLSAGLQTAQFSDNEICRSEKNLEEQESSNEPSANNLDDSEHNRVEQISTLPEKLSSKTIEEIDFQLSEKLEEDSHVQSIQEQLEMETASTQEFLDTERRVLSEETDQEAPQIVVSSEVGELQPISESISENESAEFGKEIAEDTQNPIDESSSELSASDSTFIEKTEVVVSDTGVTIYSETRQVVEQIDNLDSWTTVEEATRPPDVEEQREEDASKSAGDINEATKDDNEGRPDDSLAPPSPRAPLATPDETETSDVSNACDVSVLFFFVN